MKSRVFLAICLLWLPAKVFTASFSKSEQEARELDAKGVSIRHQAMELTAQFVRSCTMDVADASGQRLGSGLFGTFYALQKRTTKEFGVVSYLLVPEAMLRNTASVTVSCVEKEYNTAPFTVELHADGATPNVFPGSGESAGLVAILLPESLSETGCSLNALSRPNETPKFSSGMPVLIAQPMGEPARKGVVTVKGVERSILLGSAPDGQATWAARTPYRVALVGTPVFTVVEEIYYGRAGGRRWLEPNDTELAGLITGAVTLDAPTPPDKSAPTKSKPSKPKRSKGASSEPSSLPLTPPDQELAMKNHRDVSGLISRPAIAALAQALRHQLEQAGWVLTEEPPPKADKKAADSTK
jgi:hypothetical protein